MIAAAYLRVYVRNDRLLSRTWAVTPVPNDTPIVSDHFLWTESTSNDVLSLDWEDDIYLCPRFARLRMLEGAVAFDKTYPGGRLIPEQAVDTVKDELTSIRATIPGAKSHILTSPWFVPLRWFAGFSPDDRSIYQMDSGMSVRYRASMGSVTRRIDRTVRALDGASFGPGALVPLRDLARWLGGFTEDAVVELDYDRVAELFSEADLALDDSSALVGESIDALEAGDYTTAGIRYREVATRWAPGQARAFVN
jgi:hypothetical protein